MRRVQLFLAASLGCFILAGVMLVSPDAVSGARMAECTKILEGYDKAGSTPRRGTPERQRYVDCYYVVCGIRLDG